MKKIYQKPEIVCMTLSGQVSILNCSVNNLDGFGGYGGGASGSQADARSGGFWDDDDWSD